MLKYVLFAAFMAIAFAKPLVVEYPISSYEYAAYTAPVAYTYSSHYDHYDHHDHVLPYTTYSYEYAPYSHYEYLRR